jgi:hypothetical protein
MAYFFSFKNIYPSKIIYPHRSRNNRRNSGKYECNDGVIHKSVLKQKTHLAISEMGFKNK